MANRGRELNPEIRVIRPPSGPLELRDGALAAQTAEEAFGPLEAGGRVFALSKGAVGFGDVARWALGLTGPADVLLATWAISGREIGAFRSLLDDGRVASLRLVIDPSFVRRHRAYTAQLRATFGADSIRLVACHAKLAVVTTAARAIVIRSSANLNANARTEFFEVEDSPALASFIAATFADWFNLPALDQFEDSPSEHRRRFAAWRRGEPGPLTAATAEDGEFFGSGWLDRDLNRVGLSYVKSGRKA